MAQLIQRSPGGVLIVLPAIRGLAREIVGLQSDELSLVPWNLPSRQNRSRAILRELEPKASDTINPTAFVKQSSQNTMSGSCKKQANTRDIVTLSVNFNKQRLEQEIDLSGRGDFSCAGRPFNFIPTGLGRKVPLHRFLYFHRLFRD